MDAARDHGFAQVREVDHQPRGPVAHGLKIASVAQKGGSGE